MLIEFYLIAAWLGSLAWQFAVSNDTAARKYMINRGEEHVKKLLRRLNSSSETRGVRLSKKLWRDIRIYGALQDKSANDVVKTAVEEFFEVGQ